MYEAYMAEVLSRSETEQITRRSERRRIAVQRAARAPAPLETHESAPRASRCARAATHDAVSELPRLRAVRGVPSGLISRHGS